VPPDDAAADDEDDDAELLLLDDEPVHALAVASASTAIATVPYLVRHRLLVMFLVGLTCSYLLISESL
jgi:hypothetical protein